MQEKVCSQWSVWEKEEETLEEETCSLIHHFSWMLLQANVSAIENKVSSENVNVVVVCSLLQLKNRQLLTDCI